MCFWNLIQDHDLFYFPCTVTLEVHSPIGCVQGLWEVCIPSKKIKGTEGRGEWSIHVVCNPIYAVHIKTCINLCTTLDFVLSVLPPFSYPPSFPLSPPPPSFVPLLLSPITFYPPSPTSFPSPPPPSLPRSSLSSCYIKSSRVLLFSQFMMVLDVMEVFLQQEGHAYLRLDGQTPVTERSERALPQSSVTFEFMFKRQKNKYLGYIL